MFSKSFLPIMTKTKSEGPLRAVANASGDVVVVFMVLLPFLV